MKKKNNMNQKKLILIFAFVILLILTVSIAFNKFNFVINNESGDQISLSGDNDKTNNRISGDGYLYLSTSKRVEDVEFSNIKIKPLGRNKCEFSADVKNLSENYLDSKNIRVKVIDDSGEVDEVFAGILIGLAPYEPNIFKTHVLSDITDVVDIQIEMVEI